MDELLQNLEFSNIIWQIITPLLFSLFDIRTGYVQAIINKCPDSTKMRNGLWHKFLIILVLIGSFVIEYAFSLPKVSTIVCVYICVMEITSILENLKKAGIDLKFLDEFIGTKKDGEEVKK